MTYNKTIVHSVLDITAKTYSQVIVRQNRCVTKQGTLSPSTPSISAIIADINSGNSSTYIQFDKEDYYLYWLYQNSNSYNYFTFNLTDGTDNHGYLWVDSKGANAAVYGEGFPWMVDVGTIKPFIKGRVNPKDFKLPKWRNCVASV